MSRAIDYNKVKIGQIALVNYEGEITEAKILEIGNTYTKIEVAGIGDRKVILEEVLIELY